MKQYLFIITIFICSFFYIKVQNEQRSRPRVVLCDVGQGDALYLRLGEGIDVLIDAGPGQKVLNCLNSQLPYFDRQVEMAFVTHPEKDHFGGLENVIENFQIKKLFLPASLLSYPVDNSDWHSFIKTIKTKGIPIYYLKRADEISVGRSIFTVLAPGKLQKNSRPTDPDWNNLGLALHIRANQKGILTLADLDSLFAEEALRQYRDKTDVFKISHHGSRYGLSPKILRLAKPGLCVLSVGKNNFYGHPHPETLDLVRSHKIPLRRTDKEGIVIIPL